MLISFIKMDHHTEGMRLTHGLRLTHGMRLTHGTNNYKAN